MAKALWLAALLIAPLASWAGRVTPEAASRFLMQASFGPTVEEIDRVSAMGIEGWLDEQFQKPPELHRPLLAAMRSGKRRTSSSTTTANSPGGPARSPVKTSCGSAWPMRWARFSLSRTNPTPS